MYRQDRLRFLVHCRWFEATRASLHIDFITIAQRKTLHKLHVGFTLNNGRHRLVVNDGRIFHISGKTITLEYFRGYIAVFLVAWTMYTRLSRAEMMVEVKKEYILAARTLGYGKARIVFRHALPNIINSSIVFSMSDFVLNILLVSGLSFLGLGVQPPTPEWGAMVAEGRDYIMGSWWISTLPGLMIVITGTALAFIGDGLAHRLGERRHTLV